MKEFRKRADGAVITEDQLRRSTDDWILPAVLDAATCDHLQVDPVLASPVPAVDAGHLAYRNGVVQDGLGNWVWAWATREKTPEEIAAEQPTVPSEVTKRQGLRALFDMYGLKMTDLMAAIDAHPALTEDEKYLAKIDLEASQAFERHRQLVVMIATGMGLDLDALFLYAADIP